MLIWGVHSVARRKLLSSILSKDKTELFGGRGSASPGSLQDGKLATTGHWYQTDTKWFGWKPLSEAEPESTSAVQEPLIPTRAANETLLPEAVTGSPLPDATHRCSRSLPCDKRHSLWGGKCIISVGTLPECVYPRELNHRGRGNFISPTRGIKFSISWGFGVLLSL